MSDHDADKLISAIKAVLDDGADNPAPLTRARLDRIRAAAMTRHPHRAAASEAALVTAARQTLDASTTDLDPELSRRLFQARRAALQAGKAGSGNLTGRLAEWASGWRLSLPVGAMATACVMVTAITLFYGIGDTGNPVPVEEEIRLFASAEDMELYENLEFYLWLAENGLAAH